MVSNSYKYKEVLNKESLHYSLSILFYWSVILYFLFPFFLPSIRWVFNKPMTFKQRMFLCLITPSLIVREWFGLKNKRSNKWNYNLISNI